MYGKDGRFYDASFDFDGDGKLDGYEYSVMDDELFSNHDDYDDEDEEDLEYEMMLHGLDMDELENMDEDSRREAMEDAGLDPDDFDECW